MRLMLRTAALTANSTRDLGAMCSGSGGACDICLGEKEKEKERKKDQKKDKKGGRTRYHGGMLSFHRDKDRRAKELDCTEEVPE